MFLSDRGVRTKATTLVLRVAATLCLCACSASGPDALTDEPPQTREPASPTAPPSSIPPAPTETSITSPSESPTPTSAALELVLAMALYPDGQLIAVVDDRGAQVYDAQTFDVLWRAPVEGMLDDLTQNQMQIAWTDDGAALNVANSQYEYGARYTSYLSRFASRSGNLLWQTTFEDMPNITFAPDGNHFLLRTLHDDAVQIWDAATQSQTGALELPERGNVSRFYADNWSTDGSLFAGTLSIQGLVTETVFEGGSVGLSSDGPIYVPGVFIWDAATGKRVATLEHPHQKLDSQKTVLWSLDGSRIISAEEDCFIVWDTADWSYRYEILYDPRFVSAWIDLSPDGSSLFGYLTYYTQHPFVLERSVGFWNIHSLQELTIGEEVQTALTQAGSAEFLGWTPDSQSLILQASGSVWHLKVNPSELIPMFPIPEPQHEAWWSGIAGNRYFILSPDTTRLYAITPNAIVVYDAHTGDVLATLAD